MFRLTALVLVTLSAASTSASRPCIRREFGESSFVCACNSTYCDDYDAVEPLPAGQVLAIASTRESGKRLEQSAMQFGGGSGGVGDRTEFRVNRGQSFQTILGFGGAFTDSAGINIAKLDEDGRRGLIEAYFSASGLDYSLGRTNIGGCDFSPRPYTYLDTPGDTAMETFSLQVEDLDYKIPYMKQAASARPPDSPPLVLYASPWSAPAWMKTNGELIGEGQLLPEHYQLWADYLVRFLDEYSALGVDFWGMTTQNEPVNGNTPGFDFNCMGWTPQTMLRFIEENLGPSLAAAGYGDLKLMIADEQRPLIPEWAREILSSPAAYDYVDGVAVHWYMDDILGIPDAPALEQTHDEFPDKFILYSEACTGDRPWEPPVMLGSWERGERYLNNIIEDLNHWAVGWTDWNLALDMEGGPNWAQNTVDAPIIVDEDAGEYYKQPMYYALGHVTRYIPAGSVRVEVTESNETDLIYAGFERPDGGVAVVLLNRAESARSLTLTDPERGSLDLDLEPSSMNTLVYW